MPNIIIGSKIVLWVNDYSILIIVVPCILFVCCGCCCYIAIGMSIIFFVFLFGEVEENLWKCFSQQVILTSWHENQMMYRMYAGF